MLLRPMMFDVHHVAAVAFDVVRDETREYGTSGCAFDPTNAVFANHFRCEFPKVVVRQGLRYGDLVFLGTLRCEEAVTTNWVEAVCTYVSLPMSPAHELLAMYIFRATSNGVILIFTAT